MIEDDEEADSGPMPLLVDCLLADLNARHEAQQQVLAQSRAVSKQMDDALQAQMLRMRFTRWPTRPAAASESPSI